MYEQILQKESNGVSVESRGVVTSLRYVKHRYIYGGRGGGVWYTLACPGCMFSAGYTALRWMLRIGWLDSRKQDALATVLQFLR